MLRRRTFLSLGAAALAYPAIARAGAQDDADPALSARTPSLRVLLGAGQTGPGPAGSGFLFNGTAYRGSYSRLDDGGIVNLVDVEQYLYSVVPREMGSAWPVEALGAQAVCARTYVLQRTNPRRAYDLVPSEIDQVYAGIPGESAAGRAAVDATAGQVLRLRGGYASVAYSSCCGGHTESSADAWGGIPIPYLQGVPCTYCSASPNYRWTAEIPTETIAERFSGQLAPFGRLQRVDITARDASGRARAFELIAERGSAIVKGSAFRLGVGARVVRSLLIANVSAAGDNATVSIEGGGLGHGVGMCQWGARGMALAGRSTRDILTLYFPGTEIGND